MSEAIDTLLAKEEIRDVLGRYCRAMDRFDAELLASVHHEDAIDEHGLPGEDGTAAWFREHVFAIIEASWEATQHFLGNSLIIVDGERADAETYVIAIHVGYPDATGARTLDVVGARYVDRLERRAGAWRIAHRIVVADWRESRPFHHVASRRERGRRDRDDVAYRAPGLPAGVPWSAVAG
jgi:hypothetical protein